MSVFSNSPEDIKKYHREYYRKNREVLLTREREKYRDRTEEDKENQARRSRVYYQRNKERFIRVNRNYYATNKEVRKKIANEKFNCECGGKFTRANKNVHIKTKMHLKHLEGETIKIKIIN